MRKRIAGRSIERGRYKTGDKLIVYTSNGHYVGNGEYVEAVVVRDVLPGNRLRVEDDDGVRWVVSDENVRWRA